jgi:hypothetical protein
MLNKLIVHERIVLRCRVGNICPDAEAVTLEVAEACTSIDSAEADLIALGGGDVDLVLGAAGGEGEEREGNKC